jgi:hypothetical protein
VNFVLGIPGVNTVGSDLDVDALLNSGDSLIVSRGIRFDLTSGSDTGAANCIPNAEGRLAKVSARLTADGFAAAERSGHDRLMPLLSRLAVETDCAVDLRATVVLELATGAFMVARTAVGEHRTVPDLKGKMTDELSPFLAAYREGLNSLSPMYGALCFFKVIEGVSTLYTRRMRAAKAGSDPAPTNPLDGRVPTTAAALSQPDDGTQQTIQPYLGKTFREVEEALKPVIRDAIAHLTPGRDVLVADRLDDLERCRTSVPILRYVARAILTQEINRADA